MCDRRPAAEGAGDRNFAEDLATAALPPKKRRLLATGTAVGDHAAEFSSDFISKMEDALDMSGDAGDEKDVKAEEEALLPFDHLVNPAALDPQALAPPGLPRIELARVHSVIDAGPLPRERLGAQEAGSL